MSNEKALAKVEKFEVAALSELDPGIAEEMEGLSIDFDRIRVPSAGNLVWEIPTDDPDNPEMVRELIGVIVDHHQVNAYWPEKYSGQNNPPACSSMDGRVGVGNPGGDCSKCPFNKWGSGPNGGKACKNTRRLYLLRQGERMPFMLSLPPTAIKPFSNFIGKRVLLKGKRSYQVIVKITLKREKNRDGIEFSQPQFAIVGELSAEEARKMSEYAEGIKAITRTIGVDAADYAAERSVEMDEEDPF